VDHSLLMHINQAPCHVPQLQNHVTISEVGYQKPGRKTYKIESICILVCSHELVDVPVWHPLRHHRELSLRHDHSQQRQHVRMTKSLPRYELSAEPLQGLQSTRRQELRLAAPTATHAGNLLQVTVDVCPQRLDCNLLPAVFALPHIPKPTTVQRDSRWAVG